MSELTPDQITVLRVLAENPSALSGVEISERLWGKSAGESAFRNLDVLVDDFLVARVRPSPPLGGDATPVYLILPNGRTALKALCPHCRTGIPLSADKQRHESDIGVWACQARRS